MKGLVVLKVELAMWNCKNKKDVEYLINAVKKSIMRIGLYSKTGCVEPVKISTTRKVKSQTIKR